MSRPLIFVTNDDSLLAKGIASLVETASKFGDVVVIAPHQPQSGMGHAITIHNILRLMPSDIFGSEILAYSCSGTPVDCVKLAIAEILHRKPDLLLSGVNHGLNASTNVLYSGTMSAAVEGAMSGIASIGFSLDDFSPEADFSVAQHVASKLIPTVLKTGLPENVCLNVNIPKISREQFRGIKVCKQAFAVWEDRFDKRNDQFDRPYYWLTGDFDLHDSADGTDLNALAAGYASVVPTQFDLTAHQTIAQLTAQLS